MNPFNEKPTPLFDLIENWKEQYPKSYNPREVDPYTKTRIILMNGTEFESNWFSHQFERNTDNMDLRRELAVTRNLEKQQQLKISMLKPISETALQHTIGYEQLAVDLTAELAKREKDCYVKKALDFALLEDFDHLYRYANQLEMEEGVIAERLVGRYTEIMPARPTIAHHRYPTDNVRRPINAKTADKFTVLSTMIITAAEQQTMNYYMNIATFGQNDLSRKLYQEIGRVEEEHVTHYGALMDPNATWLEKLLWHEYCECYLYWSCYKTETNAYIKKFWQCNLEIEIAHLHKAVELLQKYENKEWQQVIPDGEFPAPLSLHENIDYVREILGDTVQYTSLQEDYERVENLSPDADFFRYQEAINNSPNQVPSHTVINTHIRNYGKDYRFNVAPNPIKELRSRSCDNTCVGRVPGAAKSSDFSCN